MRAILSCAAIASACGGSVPAPQQPADEASAAAGEQAPSAQSNPCTALRELAFGFSKNGSIQYAGKRSSSGDPVGEWSFEYREGPRMGQTMLLTFVDGRIASYELRAPGGSTLLAKGAYKEGRRHGPWELYYSNGKLMAKGMMRDGQRCGAWEHYSMTGAKLPASAPPCDGDVNANATPSAQSAAAAAPTAADTTPSAQPAAAATPASPPAEVEAMAKVFAGTWKCTGTMSGTNAGPVEAKLTSKTVLDGWFIQQTQTMQSKGKGRAARKWENQVFITYDGDAKKWTLSGATNSGGRLVGTSEGLTNFRLDWTFDDRTRKQFDLSKGMAILYEYWDGKAWIKSYELSCRK